MTCFTNYGKISIKYEILLDDLESVAETTSIYDGQVLQYLCPIGIQLCTVHLE